jgi:putative aldouronate transport system permease protein
VNAIFIVTGTILSLAVALLLNKIRDRSKILSSLYQSAIFFPFFISMIIVSEFVFALLNYDNGTINHLLVSLHLSKVDWYARPRRPI